MGGAKVAVKLQSGVSTPVDRSKGSLTSTRRSTERKAPPVSGSSIGSSAGPFSINTPRQVRVRLSSGDQQRPRATPRKRPASSAMSGLGQMPDSPVAVNKGTGRTAVGPWCGAFEMSASALDHEPPSPTLFMDRAGSAHRSLDGGLLEAKRSSSPMHAPVMDYSVGFPGSLDLPSSTRGMLSSMHSSSPNLHAPSMQYSVGFPGSRDLPSSTRKAELRDHSREVRLAASKGEPKGSAEARCAPRFAGGSAKRHAGHQVFQPSGRFY